MDATEFLRRQVISLAYQQLPAAELMTRAAAGDVEAFIALVCLKYPVVSAVGRDVLGQAAGVEDVAQEVFVQLWRQRESIRSADAIDGWLAQTARNLALKSVSREVRRKAVGAEWWQRHGQESTDRSPELTALGREFEQRLRQLIGTRPAGEQQVLRAAELSDDDAQAAASLGLSVNAYRVRLHRARQKLRRLLEKAGLLPSLVVAATVGAARRAAAMMAALWARRLGKLFLVSCVIAAGVVIGMERQTGPGTPAAEREPAPVPAVGPVETLQARNLRITNAELVEPLRAILQTFYPADNPIVLAGVRAFGSEVEIEFRTTRPPTFGLAAHLRARFCTHRRRLIVDGQPFGQAQWHRMNPAKPFVLPLPKSFGVSLDVVRGREEYAAAERLFDRLRPDERAGPELLSHLFGPLGTDVVLPSDRRGVSGFPGGIITCGMSGGLFVREETGGWRYAGECPGWFPVVGGDRVYCFLERTIVTRLLDEPDASWQWWCNEPDYIQGERPGILFVAADRLYMTASPYVHYTRPLADRSVEWDRSASPPRSDGFAEVRGTLFGNDGKSLLARPAADLNAPWTPVGPWPAECLILVGDGDRLLAFGHGPIYARPVSARPETPWAVVGRVQDPYKR